MRINGRIPGRPRKILILPIGYMLQRLGIPILLRQPKINNIDDIRFLSEPQQEVLRLNIPVNIRLRVHILDPLDQLVGDHKHRLHRELLAAQAEKILEAGAEKIDDHEVAFGLLALPVEVHDAVAPLEGADYLCLGQ